MKQRLVASLASLFVTAALAAYHTGGVDRRAIEIIALGILLTIAGAYFFATHQEGPLRSVVFIVLISAATLFYVVNAFLFRYSLDPRVFLGGLLVLLVAATLTSKLRRRTLD